MARNTDRNVNVTAPTEGEFKGEPTFSIPTDNPQYPFTKTLKNWRFVVRHYDALKAWVDKHGGAGMDKTAAMLAAAKQMGLTAEQTEKLVASLQGA